MVKVKKNGGTLEDFDKAKVLLSLIRAGASPDQAEKVLSNIKNWIKNENLEEIESSQIRKKIVENLNTINPDAAHGYQIYKEAQKS